MCTKDFIEKEVIRDLHGGGLVGNFRRDKMMTNLEERYYWPQLEKNMTTVVKSCSVCQVDTG